MKKVIKKPEKGEKGSREICELDSGVTEVKVTNAELPKQWKEREVDLDEEFEQKDFFDDEEFEPDKTGFVEEDSFVSLEEVVADAPSRTRNSDEKIIGDFYKKAGASGSDFYSDKPDGQDLYGGANLYSTGESREKFYESAEREKEDIGELRTAKLSHLEITGLRSDYGVVDDEGRKKNSDKHKQSEA